MKKRELIERILSEDAAMEDWLALRLVSKPLADEHIETFLLNVARKLDADVLHGIKNRTAASTAFKRMAHEIIKSAPPSTKKSKWDQFFSQKAKDAEDLLHPDDSEWVKSWKKYHAEKEKGGEFHPDAGWAKKLDPTDVAKEKPVPFAKSDETPPAPWLPWNLAKDKDKDAPGDDESSKDAPQTKPKVEPLFPDKPPKAPPKALGKGPAKAVVPPDPEPEKKAEPQDKGKDALKALSNKFDGDPMTIDVDDAKSNNPNPSVKQKKGPPPPPKPKEKPLRKIDVDDEEDEKPTPSKPTSMASDKPPKKADVKKDTPSTKPAQKPAEKSAEKKDGDEKKKSNIPSWFRDRLVKDRDTEKETGKEKKDDKKDSKDSEEKSDKNAGAKVSDLIKMWHDSKTNKGTGVVEFKRKLKMENTGWSAREVTGPYVLVWNSFGEDESTPLLLFVRHGVDFAMVSRDFFDRNSPRGQADVHQLVRPAMVYPKEDLSPEAIIKAISDGGAKMIDMFRVATKGSVK